MNTNLPTLRQALADQFTRRVNDYTTALRTLADRVDAIAADLHRTDLPTPPTATALVARIVHEIAWAQTNAGLDMVVRYAGAHDTAPAHGTDS